MSGKVLVMISMIGVLVWAPLAYAQGDLLGAVAGGSSGLTISVSPQSPAPGSGVALTVENALEDLSQSTITWYENGSVITQGEGDTSANIVAPALGKQANITAAVVYADGTTDSAQTTISPTEVDLLVDSDSYVPPFYRGRALPGPQTNLHLQAIAHFTRSNGTSVPVSQIDFTWKQDGRVLGSLSGLGQSSAVVPAALLFGSTQIEVDAASTDGAFSGSATVSVPTNDPLLVLYEDNPVYGFTYYHALGQASALSGTIAIPEVEMTFAAVPYFAQASSPNDASLSYAWTVDGSSVAPGANDPSEITLNAQNSSGQATIALTLTDSQNAFMDSNGSWAVVLGSQASSAFERPTTVPANPFTGAND